MEGASGKEASPGAQRFKGSGGGTIKTVQRYSVPMGQWKTHLVNGIVSLAISVAITVWMADDDDGPWDLSDMALAAGISGFFSGLFTSYFAK